MIVNGNAHSLYPAIIHVGFIADKDGNEVHIPLQYPFQDVWGDCNIDYFSDCGLPCILKIVWLSIIEHSFYSAAYEFCQKDMALDSEQLIVGMAPYGGVAIWLKSEKKSVLITWFKGEKTKIKTADLVLAHPDMTIGEYCDYYINNDPQVKENLEKNGLPPKDLFDKYMQQFSYRYLPMFEKWDGEKWVPYEEGETAPEFVSIEEALFDGTHDKLNDGGLLKFHEAGKPKKLAVKWKMGRSEYSAYFWFGEEMIREIFGRFYGAHPDTRTDFLIHIDAESKKYELGLFRSGLKEPHVIPEKAYQLLVFKNRFEDFRSDNYSQERGAWIW